MVWDSRQGRKVSAQGGGLGRAAFEAPTLCSLHTPDMWFFTYAFMLIHAAILHATNAYARLVALAFDGIFLPAWISQVRNASLCNSKGGAGNQD